MSHGIPTRIDLGCRLKILPRHQLRRHAVPHGRTNFADGHRTREHPMN